MTDDCVVDVLSTCKLFTRVLVSVGARFVSEAVTCIYNTLAIRARFTMVPPAVHRRVEVTPLGGPVTCRCRFVQPKPVFIARPAVHAHNIMILLPWLSRRFLRLSVWKQRILRKLRHYLTLICGYMPGCSQTFSQKTESCNRKAKVKLGYIVVRSNA